jgi:guanyl-specific ribonuclease Sa
MAFFASLTLPWSGRGEGYEAIPRSSEWIAAARLPLEARHTSRLIDQRSLLAFHGQIVFGNREGRLPRKPLWLLSRVDSSNILVA